MANDRDPELTLGISDSTKPASPDDFVTLPQGPLRTSQGDRFSVLRAWRQGGLGRVAIAIDRELNREIALKEILPSHADNEENRRRFVREAEVTGALEHPGIVPVYSLGEFPDGRPFYAMRFVRGMNMHDAIVDYFADASPEEIHRTLEFRQLLGKFVDVCHTLSYAHSRGVLHRDVKPANIMLGDYGESLVVDWGLARLLSQENDSCDSLDAHVPRVSPSDRASGSYTQAGRIVGTPAYMSPEQAEGRLDLLGPASDIYGLGATLYQLLTGQAPFEGAGHDLPSLVQQGRFKRPRLLQPTTPRALEAICLKAMARRPQDRYASAGELAMEIERYLADQPVAAYAEPWRTRLWRWIRNHRTLVMSVMTSAAVAIAALSAGVVLLTAANQREHAALDQAEQNLQRAQREQERAERNFARAQEAVQNYYVQVSEETLLNQPGMQPLRNALLRQALDYYEEFLQERDGDANLARQAAQAEFYAGRIAQIVAEPQEAQRHLERAIELCDSLLAAGDEDAVRAILARSCNALGGLLQRQQQRDGARRLFQRAADLRRALAAADPADGERARELASSLMNLGQLAALEGRTAEALTLLKQAQAIRTARAPDEQSPALIRDIGQGYYNLAVASLGSGDAATVHDNLTAAAEAFARVEELEPRDLENIRRLATTRRLLADQLAATNQPDEAVEEYQRAKDSLAQLATRNPDVPEYAADLAGVEINLAETLSSLGRNELALTEIDAAATRLKALVELPAATDRQRRDYAVAQRFAGRVLLDLNRPAEALLRLEASRDAIAELVRQHPEDAEYAAELEAARSLLREASEL